MSFLVALALANAAPAACPDVVTADAFVCRALTAEAAGNRAAAAAAFEQAAQASGDKDPASARMWAAAGNMWIAAGEPRRAALALDKALAGPGLEGIQRGEALLDRARAAEAQNDLVTARTRLNEAATVISGDPFYWYFSAALYIREQNPQAAQAAIGRALNLAPADPTILFEAGHVAQLAGDNVGARDYWQRAIGRDPAGPIGRAAQEALRMLPAPLTVKAN
jgi:tetratricopeptide (TPR) repeat protein